MGARPGGEFDHTSELNKMNFKEPMNRPDSNKQKEEIKSEHKRMVTNHLWETLNKKDLPEGANIITSTRACEKKAVVHTVVD